MAAWARAQRQPDATLPLFPNCAREPSIRRIRSLLVQGGSTLVPPRSRLAGKALVAERHLPLPVVAPEAGGRHPDLDLVAGSLQNPTGWHLSSCLARRRDRA